MPNYNSQRPIKPEENTHRPQSTNLIGTLTIANPMLPGIWTLGPAEHAGVTLSQALTMNAANGHTPLLWAFIDSGGGKYEIKFGYDRQVLSNAAVGGGPFALVKIGHVALTQQATISGEIFQKGASWRIDNNSGAWGSMGNHDGKSTMLDTVAEIITHCDPGGIQIQANRAYSRTAWKRAVQQVFR